MANSTNKTPTPPPQDHPKTPKRTQDNSKLRRSTKPTPRVRGLDEIKPFLKQIGKIVTEECQKYDTPNDLKWYTTWESWNTQELLEKTSMNSITNIICPDLFYV